MEEKSVINQELVKLQKEVIEIKNPSTIGEDCMSLGPVQPGSARYNELRTKLDALKEDLLQSETAREDVKLKTVQQEQEIKRLQAKLEDFTVSTQ